MQRFRSARPLLLALPALLLAGTVSAAFWADNEPDNVVALGGFERSGLSLRLPVVSPFPLVAGGWGARGDASSITLEEGDAWEGNWAVRIESRRDAPAHLIQDIPLATRSFRLELAVMRVRGRQNIRLLSGWDRMDPTGPAVLELRLGRRWLRVTTPEGSWSIEADMRPGQWVRLGLVADARTGQLDISVDGEPRAMVPVSFAQAPQTLTIGGHSDRATRYRYDGVRLERLAQVELAEIRRQARRWLPSAELSYMIRHLDAAAIALSRGAATLAAPELHAAARALSSVTPEGPEADAGVAALAVAADALIELLRTS